MNSVHMHQVGFSSFINALILISHASWKYMIMKNLLNLNDTACSYKGYYTGSRVQCGNWFWSKNIYCASFSIDSSHLVINFFMFLLVSGHSIGPRDYVSMAVQKVDLSETYVGQRLTTRTCKSRRANRGVIWSSILDQLYSQDCQKIFQWNSLYREKTVLTFRPGT